MIKNYAFATLCLCITGSTAAFYHRTGQIPYKFHTTSNKLNTSLPEHIQAQIIAGQSILDYIKQGLSRNPNSTMLWKLKNILEEHPQQDNLKVIRLKKALEKKLGQKPLGA